LFLELVAKVGAIFRWIITKDQKPAAQWGKLSFVNLKNIIFNLRRNCVDLCLEESVKLLYLTKVAFFVIQLKIT
jgi:hypothetical protein